MIHKRLTIEPDTTAITSNTWTDQVSEGGLIKPPEELMQNMKELKILKKNLMANYQNHKTLFFSNTVKPLDSGIRR
jgi:hypothetical protein